MSRAVAKPPMYIFMTTFFLLHSFMNPFPTLVSVEIQACAIPI